MQVAKFHCPSCGIVLKTANPQPLGKMVKCPQCGNSFAVADDATDEPLTAGARSSVAGLSEAGYKLAGHNLGERAQTPIPKKDNTALILVLVVLLLAGVLTAGGAYWIWKSNQTDEPRIVSRPEGLPDPMPVGVGAVGGAPKPGVGRKPPRPGKPQGAKPQEIKLPVIIPPLFPWY